jgi:hypothetical protein
MQEKDVNSALDVMRLSLDADGFDLRLGSIEDGVVQVILEARPEACQECLVPEDLMVQIIERAIRDKDTSLRYVQLIKSGF